MAGMLSTVDLNILKLINLYDALATWQIQRAMGWKSETYTSERLGPLVKAGLVERKRMPHEKGLGGAAWVYKVGTVGKKILIQAGVPVHRFAMGKRPVVSIFMRHSLLVNDFFISAELWRKQAGNVEIRGIMNDFDFTRDVRFPYPVPGGKYKPDGWIDIVINKADRYCFTVEVETGTHEAAAVKKKVQNSVLFADHGYQAVYGTDVLTSLWFAEEGTEHRKEILKAMAQQLREMNREEMAEVYRVTAVKPDDLALFTTNCWYMAGDDDPHPLFD
jgi:hypothetical protein